MKTLIKITSIIYAVISLFLIIAALMASVYAFSSVEQNSHTIGIIGGADGPSANYITKTLLIPRLLPLLLFGLSTFLFNIVNIISLFLKKQYKALKIILPIWLILNSALFFIIPASEFAVPLYMLYRPAAFKSFGFIFTRILSAKNLFIFSSLTLFILNLIPFKNNKT